MSKKCSAAILILVFLVCGAASCAAVKPETVMLDLINEARQGADLPPLEMEAAICAVARSHASDMIVRGYFAHFSPDGTSLSTRLRKAGIPFQKASENLAGTASVILAHQMLMNSPSHKGNMLDPNFEKVGIAIVHGGPYGLMIVEIFVKCVP